MLLKPTLEVLLLSLALICTLPQNSHQELIQDGPLQQGEANTKNTISCEDNCFVDCMTDELNECVEACRRLICPAV
ncbi:hypothetical protein ABFA07_017150 [Porites harrisoni]